MRAETRIAYNAWLTQLAVLNGVSPEMVLAEKQFTVDPSIQQKLIVKQQESSDFLKRINIVPVVEMSGDKLGLGVSGPIASRTNTTTTDRATKDPSTLDSQGYLCSQTNSDTHVKYAKLDTWAKFADFQQRLRDNIVRRQALDRIMIGFNGVSIAATSDPVVNPLLQDVNKGWLHHIRQYNAGAKVLDEGTVEVGKIIIDETAGDYKNLDALVFDAIHNLMPTWARGAAGLTVVLGDDLLHDKYFPLVNSNLDPSETSAADLIISAKRVGNKPAATVPHFPGNKMLITTLDNLSIYEQEGRRRRTIVDNAKRDQIETYESSNDAYVVEDHDFSILIENIQIGPTPVGP